MPSHIPIETRLKIVERVKKLYNQGLGYRRIQQKIKEEYGITLNRSTISYWIRGLHKPQGRIKLLDKTNMDAYAYVIGASIGDAYLRKKKGKKGEKYMVMMRVRDRDFLEEYVKNVKKIIPGIEPKIRIGRRNFYTTTIYNKLLYLDIKAYLENPEKIYQELRRHKQAFLKGVYDAEGFVSVSAGKYFSGVVELVNSNAGLCHVISMFLDDLSIKHRISSVDRRGEIVRIGEWVGHVNKVIYVITISSFMSVCKFRDIIGFSIHRKKEKLDDLIDTILNYGTGKLALEKWREKYVKIRNRWIRKKSL